jgi:hypothetical protein
MLPLSSLWQVYVLIGAVIIGLAAVFVGKWIKNSKNDLPDDGYDSGINYESYGPDNNDKDIFC